MKKYILFAGLSIVPLLSNAGMPGNFYVGAGLVGAKPTRSNVNVKNVDQDVPAHKGVATADLSKDSFALGRLQAGYQKRWNRFLVGAEVFGQLKDRKENVKNLKVSTPNGTLVDTIGINVRRNYTTGATLKLGGYFTDRLGLYASGGVLHSQFQTSVFSAGAGSVTSSRRNNVWGSVFGGGLIGHVGESVVLKAEYGYESYDRFNTRPLQSAFQAGNVTDIQNIISPKMNYQSVTLSVSYLI